MQQARETSRIRDELHLQCLVVRRYSIIGHGVYILVLEGGVLLAGLRMMGFSATMRGSGTKRIRLSVFRIRDEISKRENEEPIDERICIMEMKCLLQTEGIYYDFYVRFCVCSQVQLSAPLFPREDCTMNALTYTISYKKCGS